MLGQMFFKIFSTKLVDGASKVAEADALNYVFGYSVMLDQNQLYAMLRPSLTNLPAKRLLPYSKAKLSNMPLSMSKEEQRSAVPADKTVSDEELPKFIGELRDERTREALGLEKTIYDEMNTDKQMLAVHEKLSGKALPVGM